MAIFWQAVILIKYPTFASSFYIFSSTEFEFLYIVALAQKKLINIKLKPRPCGAIRKGADDLEC